MNTYNNGDSGYSITEILGALAEISMTSNQFSAIKSASEVYAPHFSNQINQIIKANDNNTVPNTTDINTLEASGAGEPINNNDLGIVELASFEGPNNGDNETASP